MVQPDHYSTLGVPHDADPDTIKRAYRKRSSESHPDKEGGSHEAQQAVNVAYTILSDPERRQRYDNGEAEQASGPSAAEQVVIQHFIAALQENDGTDLVGSARMRIQRLIASLDGAVNDARRERNKLEKKAKRLIFKGSGESLLHMVIESRCAEIDNLLEQAKRDRPNLEAACKILDSYEDTGAVMAPRPEKSMDQIMLEALRSMNTWPR
jgi:curved DNA-binding protein CbpA